MSDEADRAHGALAGLALGDALGMPTQAMTADQITRTYGWVDALVPADASQPYAPGMPAGSVTDDTEQALLVADLLVSGGGGIDPHAFSRALLDWEDSMVARGSLDLLGPSTKAALERVRAGEDPLHVGGAGTTNGSAMRVAPVGIASSTRDPRFTDTVWESCRVTHATEQGFHAAALVAAAVSLGIDGAGVDSPSDSARASLERALALVEGLGRRGAWTPQPDVCERTRYALRFARARDLAPGTADDDRVFAGALRARVGASVEAAQSVPAAFAIAWRYAADPWRGLCVAANLGGDTDTIGAITGAVLGAALGARCWPAQEMERVEGVSGLRLRETADGLLRLRAHRSRPPAHGEPVAAPLEGRVVLLGQVVVDLALLAPRVPAPGGDVFAEDAGMHAGGGFNVLAAARRMGAQAVSLSGVGDGGFASIITAALERIGAACEGPRIAGTDSGYCVAITDGDGERTFVSTRGAEARLPRGSWSAHAARLRSGDVVHVDGYALAHPANTAALREFLLAPLPAGLRAIVDVSPVVGDVDLDDLLALRALAPLWSMNEREAGILAGRLARASAAPPHGGAPQGEAAPPAGAAPGDAERLAAALASALGSPVVVRCGAHGAWYAPGEPADPRWAVEPPASADGRTRRQRPPSAVLIPTPQITAVDTNGAGDAHSGVLAASLAQGADILEALRLANCAGALAATRVGPATCPSRTEIEAVSRALAHH